jgi:hypothetical protein
VYTLNTKRDHEVTELGVPISANAIATSNLVWQPSKVFQRGFFFKRMVVGLRQRVPLKCQNERILAGKYCTRLYHAEEADYIRLCGIDALV